MISRTFVLVFGMAAAAGLAGCANQHVLAGGVKFAEAYAKVGASVEESMTLASDSARRESLKSALQLQPSPRSLPLVRQLACDAPAGDLARVRFATANLALYGESIGELAKAPEDSLAAVVASLKKSLPQVADATVDVDAFTAADEKRKAACNAFATASLEPPREVLEFAGTKEIKAVLSLLKTVLGAIDSQRRANAYAELVKRLGTPVGDNLTALHEDVRKALLVVAAESQRSASTELDTEAAPAIDRVQRLERALGHLARFDKAWLLFNGFYSPVGGGDSVFLKLKAAHDRLVKQAEEGRVSATEGLEDLLALIKLSDDLREQLDAL